MLANYRLSRLLGAVLLTLTVASLPATAAEHRHDHGHGGAPARLELNNGKKWETDAPLRRGMENIRTAMGAALHDIHGNMLSAAKYAELAKKVRGEVNGIVAGCKLEPKADAQLHLVVAEILEGVEAMEGKAKKTKRQAGAVKVVGALDKYGSHFDHPGWRPIEH
jgi:hypothetical protein